MSILEDKKEEKIGNYDFAFIVSSSITYNSSGIQEFIAKFSAQNIEINVFSFENHLTVFSSVSDITDGVYNVGRTAEDLRVFLNFIVYKKTKLTKQFINKAKIKIIYAESIKRENSAVCICHSKLM